MDSECSAKGWVASRWPRHYEAAHGFHTWGNSTVLQPNQILSGLQVELDPRDVATSGGKVTQFNNTRGIGGVCAQATTANQAVFNTSDANFNLEPSLTFSGNLAANGCWYNLPDLSALTQGEVFVVLKSTYSYPGPTQPPSSAYVGLWHLGAASILSTLYNFTINGVSECFGSNARVDFGSPINSNVPHIYNVRSASNSYTAYQSMAANPGFVYTSGTNTVGFPAAGNFGQGANTNVYYNGQLAYLALCSQVQTAQARTAMLSYLARRFGIALP